MSNVKKTLQMTSLLFAMVTLFCYISWHLGYHGLVLVGNINIPQWLMYIICKVLFIINMIFYGSYVIDEYSYKPLLYLIPILILSMISDYFKIYGIVAGPIQMLYFVMLSFILKPDRKKSAIMRSLLINGVTVGYQLLAIIFKTGNFTLDSELPQYMRLMFSIDMIVLLILVWSKGGVNNGRVERLVFPGRTGNERNRNVRSEGDEKSEQDVPVGKFEQWVMRSTILAVQIIQWVFILWVCSLDNLYLDALVMTTSFICHGMIISKRKHLKPIILCTLAATAMFYFAARFAISFQYSQFFPIVIGLLLVYTMYRIDYQFEKASQKKRENDIQRIKELELQLEDAWKHIDILD